MKPIQLILPGVLTEMLYLSFYLFPQHPPDIGLFILVNAVAFTLFGILVWRVHVSSAEINRTSLTVIIAFAVVFRLTLVPHGPVASDDIYRYVWDGRVAGSGVNPFAFPPDDPRLTVLHTPDLPSKMNFPHMRTIYPPLAQLLFYASGMLFGDSIGGMKLLLVVFDCCSILLLLLILKQLQRNTGLILVYAWCPLPIMYFGLDGHIDALAIPFFLLFLYLILKGKRIIGVVALGLSGLAKLYPLFIIPLLWRLESSWKRILIVTIPVLMLVAGYMFYVEPTGGIFDSFATFNKQFEFNGSVFTILYLFLKTNEGTHIVCGALFVMWLGVLAFLDRPLLEKVFLAFLGFVLVSPIVHPWYLAWLAALVTLRWSVAVVLLLALSNLSNIVVYEYHATGAWQDKPWLVFVEYLPFYVLLTWEIVQGRFSLKGERMPGA